VATAEHLEPTVSRRFVGGCSLEGDERAISPGGSAAFARAEELDTEDCWRPRDIDLDRVTNPDYRALLTGGGVLAQGIEELKQILRAFDHRTKATAPAAAPDPGDAPHVYVNAEKVDRDLGGRVREALDSFGATSALPPLVSPHDLPDQIRRAQKDQLEA
jgi:hypothetical protein